MKLRGFENVVVQPSTPRMVTRSQIKAPICMQPPKRKVTHFLDRTDPHFKRDLETSVKHVAYVAVQLTKAFDQIELPPTISNIKLRQLETVCRETVTKRRSYSDNGDVEITWTQNGQPMTAILEVKQRKTPKFDALSEFPYDTVITDEKRLFDKIRARGDTIGYLVTNYNKSVFLFVSHDKVESTYTTHTSMDRWKGRVRTYVDVPTGQFTEGIPECAAAMAQTLASFTAPTDDIRRQMAIKVSKEKLVKLRADLHAAHKNSERLRRAIDTEEHRLLETCTHDDAQDKTVPCPCCGLDVS